MFQQIPQTITTTQLQRNPKILEKLNNENQIRVIIRESEQVGAYVPINLHNKLVRKVNRLERELEIRDLEIAQAEVGYAKNSSKGLDSLDDADDLLE